MPAGRSVKLGKAVTINQSRTIGDEESPMKIDGGCHCGNITYTAEVDLDRVGICHCTDCQTMTGSAYRVTVVSRVLDS